MHIVVIGIGGVGGYFGGKIAHSGQKVSFLARGKHLEAIQDKGLQVKSIDGDFIVKPYQATHSIQLIEKADLVLVCTKSWQLEEVAKDIKPILKDDTVVLPLQNGADNAQKISKVLGSNYVVAGLCRIYSKIESPGVVSHFGFTPEIVFGERSKMKTARLQKIKEVFDKAGFASRIADDIEAEIWSKFMFIATVSGLGALTRVSIGEMYAEPRTRLVLEQTANEIYNVGVAKGVSLSNDLVGQIMNFISKQPFDSTASTQRDIIAGKPSELENFNGFIVKTGNELGVPTPVNSFVYSCLLPLELKARK